jgi:hypothetical protein
MPRHVCRYHRHRAGKWPNQTGSLGGALASQVAAAANSPVREALVPAKLFEVGIGNLVFSRSLPDGRIGLGGFLLDVFCLGVKNAFVATVAASEYAQRRRSWLAAENHQPMQPACFRKLVEGGVAYARDLGFSPHPDYAAASQIFGDVESSACPTRFEYGQEGKPFYVSGPHENAVQAKAIVEQFQQRLGPGNFHFPVRAQ